MDDAKEKHIVLKTARCIVRELTADDMDALFRLYEPEAITRYIEPLFEREKEEIYQQNYRELIYRGQGFGLWAVTEQRTGALIGRIGVEALPGLPPDTVELGYVVAVAYQRRGIATEVCRAVLDYTFTVLQKERVQAHVHPANEPSNRLMRRLGFTPTDRVENGEVVWERGRDVRNRKSMV